jgi:hypothetical protein
LVGFNGFLFQAADGLFPAFELALELLFTTEKLSVLHSQAVSLRQQKLISDRKLTNFKINFVYPLTSRSPLDKQ